MGDDVTSSNRGTNLRRRPRRIAAASLMALAFGLSAALTMLYYSGTAHAAEDCTDGAFVIKYPRECGIEFPEPETVTETTTEYSQVLVETTETLTTTEVSSVLVPTTETETTTEVSSVLVPTTQTDTTTEVFNILVPTTETVTKTETSSVVVPTTQTATTTITEPTSLRAEPTTVTVPTVTTESRDVVRNLTVGATETARTTVTDRTTERVTDTVAPTWWNAPSVNPQTGQRPGVSLSATQVRPGDSLTVKGMGGTPGEQVLIVLHSDPVQVGTAAVESDGTFQTAVVIPFDTAPGQHTIEVVGVSCGVTTSVPLTVLAPATDQVEAGSEVANGVRYAANGSALSYTGVNTGQTLILGAVLLGVGGVLSVVYRRRPAPGRHRY